MMASIDSINLEFNVNQESPAMNQSIHNEYFSLVSSILCIAQFFDQVIPIFITTQVTIQTTMLSILTKF